MGFWAPKIIEKSFGNLREFFGNLRESSGIFGNLACMSLEALASWISCIFHLKFLYSLVLSVSAESCHKRNSPKFGEFRWGAFGRRKSSKRVSGIFGNFSGIFGNLRESSGI